MDQVGFSLKQIQDIFRMKERVASRQTIFNAEERGDIPTAERITKGLTQQRQWRLDQLPAIGAKFGFLAPSKSEQHVITVWTQKGGILKTTLVQTIARALALNGIKVLVVGLDTQPSITNLLLPLPEANTLEEAITLKKARLGLYHLLYDSYDLSQVVKPTDLPTLSIIPEGPHLARLERNISDEVTREKFFLERLLPLLGEYSVIIFDNGPVWNQLVANSLACATTVMTPVGCDFGTYDVLDTHMKTLRDFQRKAGQRWQNLFMIPTLLEKTNLSQQIYMAYIESHRQLVLPTTIRRSVGGQEAAYSRLSVLEYAPTTSLADDYYNLMTELWKRMNNSTKKLSDGIDKKDSESSRSASSELGVTV